MELVRQILWNPERRNIKCFQQICIDWQGLNRKGVRHRIVVVGAVNHRVGVVNHRDKAETPLPVKKHILSSIVVVFIPAVEINT